MLLVIDVGNTQTVFAIYQQEKLLHQWRMATQRHRSADEYAVLLGDMLKLKEVELAHVDNVIISSVVPAAIFPLKKFSEIYIECEPVVIGQDNLHVPMKVNIDYPEELGADRLVNAFAARNYTQKASIIVDFGTATTFDVVDIDGTYQGGVIAPGIQLSLEALHQAAAKLPSIHIEKPENIIGKNTVSAMQSGLFYGYLSMVEGIIERLKSEITTEVVVFSTGGLAPLYSKHSHHIDEVKPNMTIHGLALLFTQNQQQGKAA